MNNKTFFDKLDALAIMAMHFNENNHLNMTDETKEIAWNEFFSFVVVKCFLKERITNKIVEENILGALESLYEKPEFAASMDLSFLAVFADFNEVQVEQIKKIMNALKKISKRLSVVEFNLQHLNNLSGMLWWLARHIGNIRFRSPRPFEIPMKFKMLFGICLDHRKMIQMYRFGLIDNPVHCEGYRYIVNYLKWRTNLSEAIIHQYLSAESYTMFEIDEQS